MGLLDKKREHYLCALPPLSLFLQTIWNMIFDFHFCASAPVFQLPSDFFRGKNWKVDDSTLAKNGLASYCGIQTQVARDYIPIL